MKSLDFKKVIRPALEDVKEEEINRNTYFYILLFYSMEFSTNKKLTVEFENALSLFRRKIVEYVLPDIQILRKKNDNKAVINPNRKRRRL